MSVSVETQGRETGTSELIARWRQATGLLNDDLFERRLRADRITARELAEWIAALGSEQGAGREDLEIPRRPCGNQARPENDAELDAARSHPVSWSAAEEALAPLALAVARPWVECQESGIWQELKSLDDHHPGVLDREAVFQSVRRSLQASVMHWIGPIAILELNLAREKGELTGGDSKARFEDFLDRLQSEPGRRDLLSSYPGLIQCIEYRTKQTGRFLIEILHRVVRDRDALGTILPGQSHRAVLSRIAPGRGDRHDGGRSVATLGFADGARLMYKPRSLDMEAAYADLIRWMNDHGITPEQRAAAVLCRQDYGYMEYVPHLAISTGEEAQAFCRRLGAMVAVTYLLSGTDMHYENVVACGEHPVLIDLETLFHPMVPAGGARGPTNDTILGTRMLPVWTDRKAGSAMEVCALASSPGTVEARVPVNAASDRLAYVKKRVPLPAWHNLPLLHGRPVQPADYPQAVVQGFESLYRGLMQIREELCGVHGPLSRFQGLSARVILRGTEVYNSLLNAFTHPDVLSSRVERERLLERLWLTAGDQPDMVDAVREERAALRRLDVPRFRIRTDEVMVRDQEDNPLLYAAYRESGREEVSRRFERMSETDLARQSRMLEQSVAGMKPRARRAVWSRMPYTPEVSPPVSRDVLVSLACRLADRILIGALPSDKGPVFLQLKPTDAVLSPVGWNLYDGLSGMALFFAQLARLSDQPRYETVARDMLDGARCRIRRQRNRIKEIGAYGGLSGWCYVLVYLGTLWDEAELVGEARGWLSEIARRLSDDRQLDLIGGAAGALWTCIRMHIHTGDDQALAVAGRCADHLVEQAVPAQQGLGWTTAAYPDRPVTGLGHGAGGAAVGLAWLAELTGSERYRTCARQALAFEQATLDPVAGTFADLRSDRRLADGQPGRIYAWCHGAPGMGLARLCLPASYRDRDWYRAVNAAIRSTLAEGLGTAHCLCHGDLGNLDLFMAADDLEDPGIHPAAWQSEVPKIVHRVRQQPRCGTFREAELLDLMGGLSGIGYGLLRLAHPKRIPSVLTLDLPEPASVQ